MTAERLCEQVRATAKDIAPGIRPEETVSVGIDAYPLDTNAYAALAWCTPSALNKHIDA